MRFNGVVMLLNKNFIPINVMKFILPFLMLLMPNLLLAQNNGESTELQSYFALIEAEQVPVTTGAGRPLTKEKMPATVTVVTASELKLLGLRHLTDVINYIVPGGVADIHRGDRTGLYCFRGIAGIYNSKYVFMVDGVNNNFITAKGAMNERYLGLMDDLDRIEITQGVGSTLYGDGAVSGVINFITKTGKNFQGTEITTGYGSWQRYEDSIKFGRKKGDREDFYYFGFRRSHGYRPRDGGGVWTDRRYSEEHAGTGREWDHFAPSFKFHSNITRGDFTLRTRYVREKYEEPYISDYDRNGVTTRYKTAADRFLEQSYLFIQPEFKHKINDNHSIKAILAFQMAENKEEKTKDWYASSGGNLILEKGHKILRWGERKLRGQLFHYYDGWENHKLTSGLDLFWIHIGPDFDGENYKIGVSGGSKTRKQSKKTANLYYAAGFVEDMWKLDERLTLFAGARIENHIKTPTTICPRLALSGDLDEKTNIKLLYNTGYRTPPWVFYTSNEASSTAVRPDPEKVTSFEAHILHKFSPKLSTTLVGYYTIYKDMLAYRSGGYKYYNFPEVKASGLELTGDYKTKNLLLKFSHSYSRPVHFSNGNYDITALSYNERDWALMPTHMTKAQAIVNLVEDKCTLGVTYFRPGAIRGQRNIDHDLHHAADYINTTLTLKLNENMEFQATAYNITGENRGWWGHRTYDGVSRDINPHTDYFVKLIWKF